MWRIGKLSINFNFPSSQIILKNYKYMSLLSLLKNIYNPPPRFIYIEGQFSRGWGDYQMKLISTMTSFFYTTWRRTRTQNRVMKTREGLLELGFLKKALANIFLTLCYISVDISIIFLLQNTLIKCRGPCLEYSNLKEKAAGTLKTNKPKRYEVNNLLYYM